MRGFLCLIGLVAAVRAAAIGIVVDGREPETAGARVSVVQNGDVRIWATNAISTVTLSWETNFAPTAKVLGDAWERTYGDTYWRGICEKRDMPWYFLLCEDGRTEGWGVETQPNALAMWRATTNRVELVIDVRAGGRPVELKGRTLEAVRIVRGKSAAGESAWDFGHRFCRMMCPRPRIPKEPVYGYNDWYCAYGKNTATNFLADAAMIVSLCEGLKVRPYVVMDDGWQRNSPPVTGESGWGPWDRASANFGMAMPDFAAKVVALGAKPGLWYRPLRAWTESAAEERLKADDRFFDPSVSSVRTRILADMRRFREWGFKLVKIDYLTHDICGIWPCDYKDDQLRLIRDEREWRDHSRTTAEVMKDLYRAMREGAGDDVVIIGCNALNHLAAGLFEVQRTGNDTSGKDWSWTRNHGVNTLAMRGIQDGAFFKVDADCVGLAAEGAIPWRLNRQWIELLSTSGTPFFVSWSRFLMTEEVRLALKTAFTRAAVSHPTACAADWMETAAPVRWKTGARESTFDWRTDLTFKDGEKVCFFGDSITHGGFYHKFVTDYYLTRFPDRNIRFRNVGVAGGTAGEARTRYEANIRANNPTAVSFFFGMNDKGSGIYTAPLTDQKIREQESRRTAYTTNMLDLVARVKRDFPKASLYFCTPTPFDDTVVFPGQEGPCARLGEKAALKGYAELVRSWCAKEGGTLVDLSATLNAFNDRKQRDDPSYTIIGKDRVHPGKPGHFLILQEFLRAQGAPGLVSSVGIDARTGKVRAENAAVADFAAADGGCSFTVTERALPYPVDEGCLEIAAETDFDRRFNRELLRVMGLADEACYVLKIDGKEICRRTGREFASGLNLATFRTTPMYRQALAVAESTERKRLEEQRLVCDLYFIRLWCKWQGFDPENFSFLAKWYDDCNTKTDYCEARVPIYLKGWKDRGKSAAALERLDEEMWSVRRFTSHCFEIVRVAESGCRCR